MAQNTDDIYMLLHFVRKDMDTNEHVPTLLY